MEIIWYLSFSYFTFLLFHVNILRSSSVDMVAMAKISFFFMAEEHSRVGVYVCHIITHSSIDGSSSCFCILTAVNNAEININKHRGA